MNTVKHILAVALVATIFVCCKKEEGAKSVSTPNSVEIAPENLVIGTFAIEGMTCEMGCAKVIEENLSHQEGVKSATVDFEKSLAIVHFDKTLTSMEDLIETIESSADGETYKVVNAEKE